MFAMWDRMTQLTLQDAPALPRQHFYHSNDRVLGFPAGSVAKNLPANARDMGFDPWSGKTPHVGEQLSLWDTTIEPVLWSLEATTTETHVPRASARQQEKPVQWEARALRLGSTPHSPQPEKALAAAKTQQSQK